jgi:hypothetical protein
MSSLALSRNFAAAGLSLVVERSPLDSGRRIDSAEIVQLDIARLHQGERYRLFQGNTQTNHVDVTSVDRSIRQLVLVVDEPARRFNTTVPRWLRVPNGVRIVSQNETARVVELTTTGRVRHFLCGEDERHLFIAQLPREAKNVADAHDALAPEIPPEYQRGIVRRQGEWFFVPVTPDERAELNVLPPSAIRSGGLAEVGFIWRRGRQHFATQACRIDPGRRLYARGQIWHPDHAPLALRGWHRVLMNREPFEQRIPGMRWVD